MPLVTLDRISIAFGHLPLLDDVSLQVEPRERVCLIGRNGSGKSTLLRVIGGELAPDAGTVWRPPAVQVARLNQDVPLSADRPVFDVVAEGLADLSDFLFPPERARSPVKALSGGERNRLLLARLFTRPANVLVLDEPTNDLDLESLELLEAQLLEFPGTVLLVSHDREFLDNVVTSTLVFEGDGRVQEYVGGYHDWLRQRAAALGPSMFQPIPPGTSASVRAEPARHNGAERPTSKRKLSFNEQREFDQLPALVEKLESEQRQLRDAVADPEFYKKGADVIQASLARLDQVHTRLLETYARWDELDSRPR